MLSCLLFLVLVCVAQIRAFTPGRWFDRVFVFEMENTAFGTTMGNPEFVSFAQRGKLFTNFFAAYHPSQPNYWAHSGATNFGQNTNGPVDLNETNLADLLEAKDISWKTYQEDYPGTSTYCATLEYSTDYKYCRKHNPYMSYISINRNMTRCARIVNAAELDTDLDRGTLPQYSFFTPNLDNDAHDTNITFGGAYLRRFFLTEGRLAKFPPRTLIIVTFDEDHYDGPNKIYTLFVGDMIEVNTQDSTRYTVFSITRTIQDNWDLGTLGRNDSIAVPMFSMSQTQSPTAAANPPEPPTGVPSAQPTSVPPTLAPTMQPTSQPVAPTPSPTAQPTDQPTEATPTDAPTPQPTSTPQPTTQAPSPAPTDAEPVTVAPLSIPETRAPTVAAPTEPAGPTSAPTKVLTVQPTVVAPTAAPTEELSKMREIFENYKLFFVIGGGLLMLIFLGLTIAFAVVKIVQAVKDRRIQVEAAQFFDKDYEMDTHGDGDVDLDNELSSDHSSDDTF